MILYDNRTEIEVMKYLKTELNVGAEKPFSLLHISDTHLCYADNRDDDRKLDLAASRAPRFPGAEETLAEAEKFAKEKNLVIAHTGDLFDFVSWANIDEGKRFTDENDVFMAAGNHEFSQYVGEAWEDADYRNQSLEKVQSAFKNDIRFSSRKMNGVNLIAVDNGYYLFEEEQLSALKAEIELGLPIILFMHTPLYSEDLMSFHKEKEKNSVYYQMAVPEKYMEGYSEHRYKQQKADAVTQEAYDLIVSCPLVKAVVTGHLHFDFEGKIHDTLPQIVTGCTTLRELCIK